MCIAVIFLTCAKVNAFEAASGKLDGANGKEEATPGDHVLSVHDMSIMLEEHNETGLLVEFFLPWCGHSRRLRPEFRRAAAAMAGKPFFARVDCSSGTGAPLCNQHEVQYHPTILLFMRGMAFEYQQRVTSKALVEYCKKMLAPPVRALAGLEDTVAALQQQQALVVTFHNEGESYDEFFAEVAENLRDQMMFASVSNKEYIEKLGITKTPAYCIMRLGYPTLLWNDPVPEGESIALAFSRFVTGSYVLLVDTLTQENFYPKLGLGTPALILFTDDGPASEEALRNLYQAAMDFKGRINFCTVNGIRYQSLAVKLAVSPQVLPALVIVDVGNETQHVLPVTQPITEVTVSEFCTDYWNGRLLPTLRSAPAPAAQGGPVFALVADDFRRLVHDPQLDVVVTFRTTWCGFCNLWAPVFLSLAATASSIQTLKFFEFDVGENDPEPALNISSFPTVMVFPAHNKTGLVYNGGRTVSELTLFLQEHVSMKLAAGPDGQLLPQSEADRLHDQMRESLEAAERAAEAI